MSRRSFPRTTPPSPLESLLAAVLAAVVAWLWSGRAERFTTDSESYLDVAMNLRAGLGPVQQVVDFWRPSLPDPLGMWPPLYPAAIALLGVFGYSPERAATLLPALAFVVFAACFHSFALRVTSRIAARTATVLVLLQPALGHASAMAWSEMPFLALIGASCVAIELALDDGRGRDDAQRRIVFALLAGLAAGLACLTRYLGTSWVIAVALVMLIGGAPRARLAAFLAPALALAGAWAAWNVHHFGRLFGPALPRSHETVVEVIQQFITAVRWTLLPTPFSNHTPLAVPVLGAIVALIVTSLVLGRSRAIAGAFAIVFAGCLVAGRASVSINPIAERYVLPLLPFVWLSAAIAMAWLSARVRPGPALGTLLIVTFPFALGVQSVKLLHSRPTPAREPIERAARHEELRALLSDSRSPVLSGDAHAVRIATGRSAVEVPAPVFCPRPFDASDSTRWRARGIEDAVFARSSWQGPGDSLQIAGERYGPWLARRITPGSPERWVVADSSAHYVRFRLE